jgi:RimJ/RimL family protein N-acetyltransferase
VSDVVIRPAGTADLDGVVALTETVAAEGIWIGTQTPVDVSLVTDRFLTDVAEDDRLALVVVEPGGAIVGQLHLAVAAYGVAGLGMMLAPEHRGQGIGRRLVAEGVAWAGARSDVHKIELQVWPHNAAAIALYGSAGFEQEGYLRNHYRRRNGEIWDAIIMGLQLRG